MNPTIIIDSREQRPFKIPKLATEGGTLQTGDYSIKGLESLFTVERKSIDDLVSSVTKGRDRFERELARMRGYHFARLLIECSREDIELHGYKSRATPKAVLNSLSAFEARFPSVAIVFAGDRTNAARLIARWAFWYAREYVKSYEALTKAERLATV